MEKNSQKMRYTDEEILLNKSIFSENEDLVKAVRKHFLQLPLSAVDVSIISINFKNKPEAKALIWKSFLPTLDGDAPLNQVIDLWMTVRIEDKTPEEAYPHLSARQTLIDYLNQQIELLGEQKEGKIKFKDLVWDKDKLSHDAYSDLLARNTLIAHVEMQLQGLFVLAGKKNETPEETVARLQKDSSK